MKNFIKTPLGIFLSTISPLVIFSFVDGGALVRNIKKFIEYMIQLDSKYVPFIIAIILSIVIFLILMHNRKKSKQKKDFEWLITFFLRRDEIYYLEIDDLIAKFKTYVIGNNEEHNKIIDALNESIKGSVENIKNGIFIPKEAKAEIGKDERVKIAFDINKQRIEEERNKLKKFVKDHKKLKKDESNRNIKQIPK